MNQVLLPMKCSVCSAANLFKRDRREAKDGYDEYVICLKCGHTKCVAELRYSDTSVSGGEPERVIISEQKYDIF